MKTTKEASTNDEPEGAYKDRKRKFEAISVDTGFKEMVRSHLVFLNSLLSSLYKLLLVLFFGQMLMLPRMLFFSCVCVCVLNINFHVLLFQPTLMRVDKPTTLENIGRQNGVKTPNCFNETYSGDRHVTCSQLTRCVLNCLAFK